MHKIGQIRPTPSITHTSLAKTHQPTGAAPLVNEHEAPVNDEQPDNATRLGHSLSAISVLPPDPPAQPKRATGVVSRLTAFNSSSTGNATAIPNLPASWTVRPPIQAKLSVSQPNDQYEQEADRVADQVMRMPEPRVQAKCACGGEAGPDGECAACKAQRLEAQAHVQTKPDDEEVIQTKADTEPDEAAPALESRLNRSRGNGSTLPDATRSSMESAFGVDFGGVHVHTGNDAVQMNNELSAQAFTHGSDIYFDTGKYEPGSVTGKGLLAHELTHVVQQKGAGKLLIQRNGKGNSSQTSDSKVITYSLGKITLEQYPTEGRAILRYQGWAWAQYLWEARPGRNLPVIALEQSEGQGMQLSIKIEAPFRVDVMIAEGTEHGIAIDVGKQVQVRHLYNFQGGVTTKLRDGSIEREAAPLEIAYEYSPLFILEGPSPPRKKLPPRAPTSVQPLQPVQKPIHKTWSFDTAEKYEAFALSHKGTKWAEILTKEGKHVAFALTAEAVTRMAERLRKADYNFEFLSEFPGGKVVSVHLYGKKLASVDALTDLYFRNSDAALVGTPNAPQECEVFQMEQKRFGRKALLHREALARWDEIEKLPPDSFNLLKTDGEYTLFALRVRGASGLQTISATDLPTMREELTKKREFAPTSPIADDLSLLLPTNLAYGDIVSALQTLYRRKLNITEGREGTEELDAINSRIQILVGKLHELGVRRSDTEIFDAIQKGVALNKITGRLVVSPERDKYYFGERIAVRVVLDYLPPGSTVEVAWRWSAKGKEYLFPSAVKRSKLLELTPEAPYFADDVSRAMGFEVKAYLYVDDAKTPTLPLSTTWISLVKGLPPTLTIGGPKTIVQGAWAEFRVAEWTPIHSDYSLDWFVNGTRVVEDLPALRRKFDTIGTHKVLAKIYRVDRNFGIQSKVFATEINTDFEVQDMEAAGSTFLGQTAAQKLPSLPQVGRTMVTSIEELEKRVAQGGTAASYWKMRLEAEKKRQESLERLAPDYQSSQDLPTEPTSIAGQDTYSGPIPAALVLSEGGVQPLQMYLTVKKEGGQYQARLLDITGADVWKFDGNGSTPLEAYTKAFETWKGDHPYPRHGKVVYSFSPQGWTLGKSFETTRIGNTVKAWVDGLLTVGALIVTALLLAAPEATITKALGLMMLAATVARSTVAIAENISLGIAPLDSRNILEAASILTSFMGVGGTVLRQVGIRAVRPIAYRAGSWLVLATVTADAAALVYATNAAIEQMRAIQADPTKDEGQKSLEMLRLAATLMMQGTMFVVANKDLLKGPSGLRRSDFFATDPKATLKEGKWVAAGEVKLEPGARLDVAAELRKAGDDVARITKIPDAELLTRYSMMPWLSASLGEAEIAGLLKRASTAALTGLSELSAKEAKRLFERIGNDPITNDLAPRLRGPGLDALVTATGSEKLADLHGAFGTEGTAKLAGELGADRVGHLVNGKEAITAAELKDLSEKLGNGVLKNLAYTVGTDLSGKDILALVKTHGEDAVKWAGKDLRGKEAKTLLIKLTPNARAVIMDITAVEALDLVTAFGIERVNSALSLGTPGMMRGSHLRTLQRQLHPRTMLDLLDSAGTSASRLQRLVKIAENIDKANTLLPSKSIHAGTLALDTNAITAISQLLRRVRTDGSPIQFADLDLNRQEAINAIRAARGLDSYTDPPLGARPTIEQIVGPHADLRATQLVGAEELAGETTTGTSHALRSAGGIGPDHTHPDYPNVINEMAKAPQVGGPKGAVDRTVIADVMFAQTDPGVTPSFVTTDQGIPIRLASRFGVAPRRFNPVGSSDFYTQLINRIPEGRFTIEIFGHHLDVIFHPPTGKTPKPP